MPGDGRCIYPDRAANHLTPVHIAGGPYRATVKWCGGEREPKAA